MTEDRTDQPVLIEAPPGALLVRRGALVGIVVGLGVALLSVVGLGITALMQGSEQSSQHTQLGNLGKVVCQHQQVLSGGAPLTSDTLKQVAQLCGRPGPAGKAGLSAPGSSTTTVTQGKRRVVVRTIVRTHNVPVPGPRGAAGVGRRGAPGPRGSRGSRGPSGPRGEQGRPGVNATAPDPAPAIQQLRELVGQLQGEVQQLQRELCRVSPALCP